MEKRCLFLPERPARTAPGQHAFRYPIVVLLVALSTLGGLSSCQHAPYAYFNPTPHPAHQRTVTTFPATAPAPDSLATASLDNRPSFPARPIWAETTPAPEAAIATDVRRSTVWRRVRHLLPRKPAPPQCDQIVLRNGDVVEAKVKEVGVNEIRYKKCDRQDGPDYTISKRDVLSIKYVNGEVERFSTGATTTNSSSTGSRQSYNSPTNPQDEGLHTDPFAIVSIVTGGLAVLTGYGAFLLGAAAIVFGALSLSRIRKEPARFKGRGLALGGMIAGIVAAGVILLYILL